jgi:ABC-type transport system involved in resistance to organic solvents, ATPase component
MIEVQGISKSFPNKDVLKDISVIFEPAKCNLIIGQSGSGKTVLMKTLVGLLKPDKGNILFDGRNFTQMSSDQQIDVRKDMGMIFQGGALFDSMTIEENVMFPIRMFHKDTYKTMLERVNTCLERVNLSGSNKLMPSELSGGMKKRVAIARAIAIKPKYLFCDEPNSGLDPQTSIVIDDLISEITHEYGMTTIINTHDMNSVVQIGERIVYLYSGQLWWKGDKETVLDTDNKELNDFIFCNVLTRKAKRML